MVSVCLPSDALLQHLPSTWVSLTFYVGYLSMFAPAKLSCLLLTLDEGYLLMATPPDLECGVAPLCPSFTLAATTPWMWGCSSWLPPLTYGMG